MEFPIMSSDEKITKMLKWIKANKKFEFDGEMKKDMVWTLLDCLIPSDISSEAEKQMSSLRTNYARKFDRATGKATKSEGVLIEMIWKVFLDGIWWETFGTDSEEGYLSQGDTMRIHKSISRRLTSVRKEIKDLERQNDSIMEEKGLMTKGEVEVLMKDLKQKTQEEIYENDIVNRKKYMTLQKQLSDIKSERNHVASENNRIKIDLDYLRKENEELMRQHQQSSIPPHD